MRIVTADNAGEYFDNMLYGKPSDEYRVQLEDSLNRFMGRIIDTSGRIREGIIRTYDRFLSDEAIERAHEVINVSSGPIGVDNVYRITEENYKSISPFMQTIVMANPYIRKKYEEQDIHGYEETLPYKEVLTDFDDGGIYNTVMSGIANEERDCEIFTDSMDYNISDIDKFAIIDTWENMMDMIANETDPTDI